MVDELVLEDEKTIRVFSDPLHQRMLSVLGDRGPQTSSGLARLLGDEAARLHYHLKRMEAAGLVELDHEETIHGIRARFLRPAARTFRISRDSLTLGGGVAASVVSVARNQFHETLELLEALVRRQSSPSQAPATGTLSAGYLRLTLEESQALLADYQALHARYQALSDARESKADETGLAWNVLFAAVPRL